MAIKYLAIELTGDGLYEFLQKINGKSSVTNGLNIGPLLEHGVRLHNGRFRPETVTKGRRVIDELGMSLAKRGLSSLLRHGDRNSMRFAIESRVPFLTPDFANLVLSMPEEYLISQQGKTKHVFKAAMSGIVPDVLLNRKDKIGFGTPERDWMIGIADEIRVWLQQDLKLPFLDQRKILQEFDTAFAGRKPFSSQHWRWVNFIRWHNLFLKN